MPIPASVLYPAMLAAADNPDLLDTLLELSQDVDTLPEALLSPDDPEFHAAHRRLANRLRDHLGWIDDDLEEAIDAVSLSDFPVTASQQIPKPLEESQHRYATTQFLLPDDISTSVRRLADSISDDVLTHTGREQRPHITVKYGLQGDPEMVRQAVENYGPVHVRLGKTSLFPAGETQSGYEVVKIDVDSDDLHGLNRVICDAIPHVNTHPTYHPHVTLGYVQPGMGGNYAGLDALDGTEVLLNELVFSDATKQETRISLGEGKKIHPTAKVDEVLAVISAAREGDADVTAEELAGLMQGLSQDDIEKVKAVYGGDVVEGKGGCQSCGKQLWEGVELLSDDEDPVEDELTEAEVKGKGYTGALKDKNGRIYCLNKGKRVKCSEADLAKAKEEFKDASSLDVSTEKPETPKQPKPEKPTTDSAHEQIQSLLKAEVNDDTIAQIASALKSLTVKDITEIKQKLGLKASGKKEELINKIAQKAVEGARKARETKPVEQETKPVESEKFELTDMPAKETASQPEENTKQSEKFELTDMSPKETVSQSPEQGKPSSGLSAGEKGILQSVADSPVESIADLRDRLANELPGGEFDKAIIRLIDQGLIHGAVDADASSFSDEKLKKLVKFGDQYFTTIMPADQSEDSDKNPEPVKDEKPEPVTRGPEIPPEQPAPTPSNTLSPLTNSLQSLRDNGGSQDDFLALGLNKLPVKELAKVAGELGVTSKDNSKTGLIRAIQRHVLEKPGETTTSDVDDISFDMGGSPEPQKQSQEPSSLDDDSIVLDDDPVGNDDIVLPDDDDIVLPDDDDIVLADDDGAITLDDDPKVETAAPRKPDKPKKIMANAILEDKVISETVQQLAKLFDEEDIASSEQHQKNRDEQISKQRKRLSPQYQSLTVDELIALQPQLSEKLSQKGRAVKDKREDSENYNAIMQIAVASSPVMKAKPDQDKIIEKLTSVLSKNVTSPMKFQLGKHEPNVSSEAVHTTSKAVDILGSIMQMRRSDVSVNFDLVNIESRAHYSPAKKYINTGDRYNIGTAIHEICHAIELHNPLLMDAGRSFLEYRTGDEKPVSLQEKFPSSGYEDWEFGRKDKFDAVFGERKAYYTGKRVSGSTEILTMGLQKLFEDPVDFAKKDPEYVGFLVGILNGSLSGDIGDI